MRRLSLIVVLALMASLCLSACGQKGPLRLPDPAARPAPTATSITIPVGMPPTASPSTSPESK